MRLHNVYTVTRYNLGMESRHLLSPNQYFFTLSQKDKLSKSFNKSQDLARIKKTVEIAFNTFALILESNEFSREQIDEMFPAPKIRDLLMDLVKNDATETFSESLNKLLMAQSCLERGLLFFETRYKEVAFYHDKISEFKSLISTLTMLANQETEEENALKFYKVRGKMKLPPTVQPHDTLTIAMCRICWEHYSAGSKEEAIKKIKHTKHCPYDKTDLDRCIETFPPKHNISSNAE